MTDHILGGDDMRFRLDEERTRLLSAAHEAMRASRSPYLTEPTRTELLSRHDRLKARAGELGAKLKAME